MKLYGFTTSYNNEEIVPIVMGYATKLGYDKLTVFDNDSTDKTVELLNTYPFIEVVPMPTNGVFDDDAKTSAIENWVNEMIRTQTEEETWVTVSDFDEVIWLNNAILFKEYLEHLLWCGYNVCTETIMDLYTTHSPLGLGNVILPHELPEARVSKHHAFAWNKPSLFSINGLREYYPTLGGHFSCFIYDNGVKQFYGDKHLVRFHLKKTFLDYYLHHQQQLTERPYRYDGEEHGVYTTIDTISAVREWQSEFNAAIPCGDYIKNKFLTGNDSFEHGHQVYNFGDFIWGDEPVK